MKIVRLIGLLLVVALFLFFLRETVGVFTDEDVWFLHYLW